MALQGYPARVHTGGVKILAGTITLGASSISSTDLVTSGVASSVVRNSAGDYTITLADPVGAFVGFSIEVLAASAADLQPQLTALSTSNKTVQFRVLTGAIPTDGASGVVIYVVIMVKEMA